MPFRLALLILLFSAALSAQTTVPSPVPSAWRFAWDHSGTNVEAFLLCIDAQPCQSVGLPLLEGQTPAQAGDRVYGVPFPSLQPGPHTISVKTQFQGAEQPSATPFAAELVLIEAPKNLRAIKGG